MEKVVITGASRGLGYELLKIYLANQQIVFPVVRSKDALDKLQQEFPTHCYPILADVGKEEARDGIHAALAKHTDTIDILINNAGVPGKGFDIESIRTMEVNELFNIHCLGPIRVVQACLPLLRCSANPRIINISSRLGSMSKTSSGEFIGRKFSYSYRMAKAAQNMFTVCLSQELQAENIAVCAIHPGLLLTGGGSSDADTEPSIGAANIYHYAKILTIESTGEFIQPYKGCLPW